MSIQFSPEWTQDNADGSYTVYLSEIDILGYGATKEQAATLLAKAAAEYADAYFADPFFYAKNGRQTHEPYLRQVAACGGDLTKLKAILCVV